MGVGEGDSCSGQLAILVPKNVLDGGGDEFYKFLIFLATTLRIVFLFYTMKVDNR